MGTTGNGELMVRRLRKSGVDRIEEEWGNLLGSSIPAQGDEVGGHAVLDDFDAGIGADGVHDGGHGWTVELLRVAWLDRVTPQSVEHLGQCLRRLERTATRLLEEGDLTVLWARGNRNIGLGR